MFQGSFKIISEIFHLCFREVSLVSKESFKGDSRGIHGCFIVSNKFQICFPGVSQECFKDVTITALLLKNLIGGPRGLLLSCCSDYK